MTERNGTYEPKKVLLGLTEAELVREVSSMGMPRFVGKQIAQWIYGKNVKNIDEMRNISKENRLRLSERMTVGCAEPIDCKTSSDGTKKYLFPAHDGQFVETVFIPETDRATLCVSSQVGCKMHCAFCMTGRQGYHSSLSAAEILNQIYSLPERERLTNVVFMGQGKPFDNTEEVLRALEVLTAQWGYAWSPKRITVSTVGLAQGMQRFLKESSCHLAVSLHHPLPAERQKLIPAEKAFPIEDLVNMLKNDGYFRKQRLGETPTSKQRRLSFEYIVFKDTNDSTRHAQALVELLSDLDCRVNLIRFHDIPDTDLRGVGEDKMIHFRNYLTNHGLFATIRASRGQDIDAACGLLNTKKQMELREKSQK